MDEESVVYLKVFDEDKGDVVFEGKVSTDVEPRELTYLRCFRERGWSGIFSKATNETVKSFRGLQNNVELVAGSGNHKRFSGLLYVGADKVVRKSGSIPSCECVMLSVWRLSHEECEKAFKCETLEELEMYFCKLRQIPTEMGKMKKLNKLTLYGLDELKSVPEEIGELSNLEELQIEWSGVEGLSKKLKDLKMLKSISLVNLANLQLNADNLVVCSKLKHLVILDCIKVFAPPFARVFWEMIKSMTDLRVLELDWNEHNQEMVVAALEENGSIVDGGWSSELYAHFFKRNKENHVNARECIVHLLAIRRWRNAQNGAPKEMAKMIGMMLWNTRSDVKAWRISDKQTRKKARSDE